MKLERLLTLGIATALLSVMTAVGCSEPDVSGFEGNAPQRSATHDDDDDDVRAQSSEDDETDVLDESDSTGKTTKKDKATTTTTTPDPAPTKTPEQVFQECFTHCLGPVPEAVELDACSNECPDGDTECLGACYDSSNCGETPLCDQAIDQCGMKCSAP